MQTREVTKENFAGFGLREVRGVAVEKVIENSPAARGGLQNGDVIVRFNGEEVTSTRKLTRLINEVAPDHQAKLTVLRGGGDEREIAVTLGKREMPAFSMAGGRLKDFPEMPDLSELPALPQIERLPPMSGDGESNVFIWRNGTGRQIGVGVTPLTKQLGEYFGAEAGQGLLINNIRENSPAARAGLKTGDIITEVDGKPVKGSFDLIRALGEKKEGDVNLTIIRDRNRQTIRVTPETVKGGAMPFERFENFDESDMPRMNFNMTVPVAPSAPPSPQIAPFPKDVFIPAPRIL